MLQERNETTEMQNQANNQETLHVTISGTVPCRMLVKDKSRHQHGHYWPTKRESYRQQAHATHANIHQEEEWHVAQALAGNELGRRSKARRDKAHRGPCQCRSTVAAANKAGSGTSRQTMQVNAFNTQLRSLSVSKAGGRRIIANALCKIATPS